MIQQLKGCNIQSTDILVKYSPHRTKSFDFANLCFLLEQCGHKDLIPYPRVFTLLPSSKKIFQQDLGFDSYRQEYLFQSLFPQHPLVDMNHSASVDAIQLAHLVRLVVELHKPVKERHFPDNLMQGLEHLSALDREFQSTRTLDSYFKVASELSHFAPRKRKRRSTLTPLVDRGCGVLEECEELQIRTKKHSGHEDEYEQDEDEDTMVLD